MNSLQTDAYAENDNDWMPCTVSEWDDFIDKSQFSRSELEDVNFDITAADVRPFCQDCHSNCGSCTGPLASQCETCGTDLKEFTPDSNSI